MSLFSLNVIMLQIKNKAYLYILTVAIMLFAMPASMSAQGIGELFAKVMGVSDSAYVLPERFNSYANTYMFDSNQSFDFALSGGKQRLKLMPTNCPRVGIGAGYSIFAGSFSKSLNEIKGKKQHNNTNFSFDIIANRWGLQIYNRKVNGEARIVGSQGFVRGTIGQGEDLSWDGSTLNDAQPVDLKNEDYDGFTSRETGVDFYYVFNFKKFSYKAAYGYSTRQLQSAGSVIGGISYVDFRSDLVLTHDPFIDDESYDKWFSGETEEITYVPCVTQEVDFRYRKLSAKLGYGYNWAFAHNFVLNATLYPVLSLKWSKVTTYSLDNLDKSQNVYNGDWSLNFTGRGSVQWNNGQMYAGVYGDFTTFSYNKPEVKISQLYAEMRVCMGVYFNLFTWKKKKN